MNTRGGNGVAAGGGGEEGLDEFLALEMQALQSHDSESPYDYSTHPSKSNNPHSRPHSLTYDHPTNPTSLLSRKTLPCESCGEGARRPAVVYCENCCGNFCADCDVRFHPKTNLVMSRHTRVAAIEHPRTSVRCRAHPDDPVTYFCLDCQALSCSECVIHGSHRGHAVQDKRKAYYLIKDKTEEILGQFHAQTEDLTSMQRKIENLKQEIVENTRSVKQTMAMSFNEVRDRLNKKEEELMTNADLFMSEQVGQLDMYTSSTRDKIGMLGAVSGMIREQLEEQDEVGLIHFYTEHNSQFLELANTIAALSQDLPSVATRKCYLDVEAANTQISILQGLHLVLAGLHNDPPIPRQSTPPQIHQQQQQPQQQSLPTQNIPPNEKDLKRASKVQSKVLPNTKPPTQSPPPIHKTPQGVRPSSQNTNRTSISPVHNRPPSTAKPRK